MIKEFESILRDAFSSRFSTVSNKRGTFCFNCDAMVAQPRKSFAPILEPQTTEQIRLARIFCDVLDLPQVDIRDSFFVLGGDSLLSIQVVALARSIGYHINASHVLELETVENLANLILSASFAGECSAIALPEKEVRCGLVELNPIQRWFFSEKFPVPNHYNQSRMFLLRHDIDAQSVEVALLELVRHHDALRLSFKDIVGNVIQTQHSKESASRFLCFRTVQASKENLEVVAKETWQDQRSLNTENGPIVAATFFDLPSPDPPMLYIVIHHLVVDEVSWSVIANDLNVACACLIGDQQVILPPKSHSFGQWTSALRQYSTSSALLKEVEHWKIAESSSFKLPLTPSCDMATAEQEEEISTSVHIPKTVALTSSVSIQDKLVAALAFSLAQLSASPSDVGILIEGHGREESVVGPGFDLSRTVGWFTSIFPVRFDFGGTTDAEIALLYALKCLRKVPNNGIGYGLLKYPFSGSSSLSNCHGSQVTFNYLGRSGRNSKLKMYDNTDVLVFEKDDFLCGSDWDPRNQSDDSVLDVSCYFLDESLEMTWRFRSNLLARQYVLNLCGRFETNIVSMVGADIRHRGLQFDIISLSSRQAKFDDAVGALWAKHRFHDSFHGLAMSAVVDGKILGSTGQGFRDSSRTIRADSCTVFSLGSTGKPLVSLLGAVLADEGVIDLDASLEQSLLDANLSLPSVYGRMTLRQLFLMTAGIPHVETHMEETIDDPFEICRQIQIEHEPGTHFLYSNFSYALGGYLLALRVGIKEGLTNFEDLAQLFLRLLQEKVLLPVGMKDARPESYELLCKNGLKCDTGHTRNAVGSIAMLPEGPVKASAMDLAQFLITEYQQGLSPSGQRVASESRVAERLDVSHSLGFDWGMGWFRDRTHGFLHMSGQWADAVSGSKLDPMTGFGISYLVSVRDSSHLQFLEMDMDRLFLSMINAED
jgi:non-ribosomal peptide synthase protein (TIGR01720 family)